MLQFIRGMGALGSIGFGIIAMMLLLDVRPASLTKPKRFLFGLVVFGILAGNFATVLIFSLEQQAKYYMLLVHLPLAILFWAITKIHPVKIVFTLFTAVFLIFPANLVSGIVARLTPVSLRFLSMLGFFTTLVLLILFLNKFLKKDFQHLVRNYSTSNFLSLFSLPLIYNITTYWIGKYNYTISTSANSLILRSLLFSLTFTAYLLVLDISRTDREKQAMKHEQAILSLQLESANRQMSFLRATQEQAAIYRHDMHHHFTLLSGFANDGNLPKIKEYLSNTTTDIKSMTPIRYCENETVNLLLISYEAKAKKENVVLCPKVALPHALSLSDTELCSLFSNALENAVAAASKVCDEKLRKVYIHALISSDKLVFSTENAYVGKLEMDGEFPKSQSNEAGHGFGIKSMIAIAEQHNGLYSIQTTGGVFILQLMLPLETKE